VRGYGATPAEAFIQAAIALTAVITEPELVRPSRRIEIACTAPDREILFVDWLNRLISAMATEEMLFGRFEVEISRDTLKAAAYGEPIDPARHRPAVEVKGATFTELEVAQDPDGRWRAQCVVDV
jgi:SHS2 domain-containing protein